MPETNNKKVFVFDLDETLLSEQSRLGDLVDVTTELSSFNPYEGYSNLGNTYVINKEAMKKIFKDILANGDEIAFVTAGSMERDAIKRFCEVNYEVELPSDFKHFNRKSDIRNRMALEKNKNFFLQEIQGQNRNCEDVVFVDNDTTNVTMARKAGFTAIQANNGEYINQLKSIIEPRTNARKEENQQYLLDICEKASKKVQNRWLSLGIAGKRVYLDDPKGGTKSFVVPDTFARAIDDVKKDKDALLKPNDEFKVHIQDVLKNQIRVVGSKSRDKDINQLYEGTATLDNVFPVHDQESKKSKSFFSCCSFES